MLESIKKKCLKSIAPTSLYVLLFFPILFICGIQNALISLYMTLSFTNLVSDEFVESNIIKSTFIYIGLALLSYVGVMNVYACAAINFIAPFMIIYLFLDEFNPTNQISFELAFIFFQMIPVDLKGLPIRIGAIVGASIVTYIVVVLTRFITKKKPNRNIRKLTVDGIQEVAYQLDAVINKDFVTAKEHQRRLFSINQSLSGSIYGAKENLVFSRTNGQHYFPFIIVFQHVNHLIGDICDKPDILTQETLLYLEELRDVMIQVHKLTEQGKNEEAAMLLIQVSTKIEIEQVNINDNIVYILNYLSTALMDLSTRRKKFSIRGIQFKTHIWYQIKSNFNIHSFKMRFALRTSIAVFPITTLVYVFKLPHGYWMPMTVLMLILPFWENSLRKIIDRVIGTLVGVALFFILYHLFPGYIEQMIILVAVNFCLYATTRYAFTAIFLTCSSFAINVAVLGGSDELFWLRIVFTLSGALVAVFASFFIFPTNNATEQKNMMQRLLDIDDFLLDALIQLAKGNNKEGIKRDLLLTSYLVSGKIENHCRMSKSDKTQPYVKRFIMLNNKFVTDLAHIYTLMAMQQKERIDQDALIALLLDLKATTKAMKGMLSKKKVTISHPKLNYNQVYDDVYINGKMMRSADCLYHMHDCVQSHLMS